jgi:hypothetical protein
VWATITLNHDMTTAILADLQASTGRDRFDLFNAPITRIVSHRGDVLVLFTHVE